jgi:D-alanyl-D-alanine carboxypeptidase/D-alanyl-D-alanine-endopeptidase (penicillin-binding protein 4)
MWIFAPLAFVAALAASPPPPSDLPAELEALVRSGPLGHSHSGIEVFSLEDGRVLYGFHAHDLLNPASNTKIFTSAAALYRLGPDYRWATEIFLDSPPDHGGVVKGNLTLRGKGDPTLLSERMWEIATELWHLGLRQVKGDLILDDSFFDAVYEGPGWDQEDTDRAYLAPISALASNWGSFAIYVSPGDRAGQKARVEIEPMSPYFKLDNQVITGGRGVRRIKTSGSVARDGYHVKVSGHIPSDSPTAAFWRKVGDPTRYTGETFRAILAQRGIKITGRIRRGVRSPSAKLFFTSQSDGLDIILKRLNKQSSNFVAEVLVKTLGAEIRGVPGTWPNGIDAIEDFLGQEVGIPRGSYVMRNGSGLNDVNRFSADQIVRVLAYMYSRLTVAPEYLSSLPIAAKDGTIRFRMQDTPAAGRVRAKTGTLEDVSALSGYVESLGGRHYAFSLLVNDYPSSLRQAIASEDSFAVALASAGGSFVAKAPALLAESPAARRTRAEGYLRQGREQDPANAPLLLAAISRETDPAVRATAAEALYRCEPDESEAVEALLDSIPGSPEEVDKLLTLAGDLGQQPAPLLPSIVDLATDGDPRGLRGLLGLAATESQIQGPERQAWDEALAQGLADVAQQTPRELLDALAGGDHVRSMVAVGRLGKGLATNPDAASHFAEALAEAAIAPQLSAFALQVKSELANDRSNGASAGSVQSIVNEAVPRRAEPGHGG